jgi:hypothetical protein
MALCDIEVEGPWFNPIHIFTASYIKSISVSPTYFYAWGPLIFQKSSSHLKIIAARKVT